MQILTSIPRTTLIAILLISTPSWAQEQPEPTVFKSYDANGRVVFSDTAAPSSSSQAASKIKVTPSNVIQAPSSTYNELPQRRQQARSKPRKQNPALNKLKAAKQQQQDGKNPNNDEWQHTVKGRRFLKPSYFERQQQLQQQVDSAEREYRKQQ